MNKEELHNILLIVEGALNKIFFAERTIDKRKRDKAIREAKVDAQNMVYPYKPVLIDICHLGNLGDDLFDWGHLESDLDRVCTILKDLYNQK